MVLNPYYNKTGSTLYLGDCLNVMGDMEPDSIDAIVTDPSYGMASIFDVVVCILEQQGPMPTMKLQKLVYYSQAWSLVWDEEPLFPEPIEAWANGPVVRDLYLAHRGRFKISSSDINKGDSSNLIPIQKETIDAVLRDYGSKSSQWLSDLTHRERPWLDARKGLAPGTRGSQLISLASMAEYYEAVASDGIDIDSEFV